MKIISLTILIAVTLNASPVESESVLQLLTAESAAPSCSCKESLAVTNTHTNITERKWEYICIIGNAESVKDAVRSHKMWNDAFQSYWYVWGTEFENDESIFPSNLHIIKSVGKKTWAQGIEYLKEIAQSTRDCEYIFTHDDDLHFKQRSGSESEKINEILVKTLLETQPAVAGFPWSYGDQTYSGMKNRQPFQVGMDVSPLTGFDSGMVIYHKSIVDFFIPYSPRGEGGFSGNWSLCAHFITLFAPSTFQGSAIRINALEYENLVSISNVPVKQRKKKPKIDSDGLVVQSESRHPYEFKLNRPYIQFLSSGLRNKHQRWGREMQQQDVVWDVSIPNVKFAGLEDLKADKTRHRTFDKWDVIERLLRFYDITHPALSSNQWIQKNFEKIELNAYVESQRRGNLKFVLKLFTEASDISAFIRLWHSLNMASPVPMLEFMIQIYVENSEPKNFATSIKNLQKLQSLESKHGHVEIFVNTKRKGPLLQILDSWFPMTVDEFAIMIPSDTLVVSPHILEFCHTMTQQYLNFRNPPEEIIGISLDKLQISHHIGTSIYIAQYPPENGMILTPGWANFVTWFHSLPHDFDPMIYDSPINQWNYRNRPDKFLARYLVETGTVFIFPNSRPLVAVERDSLMGNMSEFEGHKLLSVEEMPIVDYRLNSIQKLSQLNYSKKVRSIDKCTLMLYVKDRTRITWKRLNYYQENKLVDSIVVLWNSRENSTHLVPLKNDEGYEFFRIPVYLMDVTKINNIRRFINSKSIKTTCIVNLDEDTDIYHDDLTRAIRRFQTSHYDQLIKFKQNNSTDNFSSFGSGVFHVRYLSHFKEFLADAKSKGDADCEGNRFEEMMTQNAGGIDNFELSRDSSLFVTDEGNRFVPECHH